MRKSLRLSLSLEPLTFYADDLLYITNPISSLPPILQIFYLFGKYSGYKLNLQKSELFPINLAAETLSHYPFPLSGLKKDSDI